MRIYGCGRSRPRECSSPSCRSPWSWPNLIRSFTCSRRDKRQAGRRRGPHPLTKEDIGENVTRQLPGAYALGYSANGKFYIAYVGRSDSDVKKRLHDHIGENSEFKYEYYGNYTE